MAESRQIYDPLPLYFSPSLPEGERVDVTQPAPSSSIPASNADALQEVTSGLARLAQEAESLNKFMDAVAADLITNIAGHANRVVESAPATSGITQQDVNNLLDMVVDSYNDSDSIDDFIGRVGDAYGAWLKSLKERGG